VGAGNTRWTKQIKIIIDVLYESDGPLTADEVYSKARRSMPNISLGTVYRNLKKLTSKGLISETNIGGVQSFSKHPFRNAHFECQRCGKLVCVPIELNVMELDKKAGMRVNKWTLLLDGICKECEDKCT